MHLASLVAKDDLPDLLKVILRTKSDFIAGHIERFYHSMTEKSDKEQIGECHWNSWEEWKIFAEVMW